MALSASNWLLIFSLIALFVSSSIADSPASAPSNLPPSSLPPKHHHRGGHHHRRTLTPALSPATVEPPVVSPLISSNSAPLSPTTPKRAPFPVVALSSGISTPPVDAPAPAPAGNGAAALSGVGSIVFAVFAALMI